MANSPSSAQEFCGLRKENKSLQHLTFKITNKFLFLDIVKKNKIRPPTLFPGKSFLSSKAVAEILTAGASGLVWTPAMRGSP